MYLPEYAPCFSSLLCLSPPTLCINSPYKNCNFVLVYKTLLCAQGLIEISGSMKSRFSNTHLNDMTGNSVNENGQSNQFSIVLQLLFMTKTQKKSRKSMIFNGGYPLSWHMLFGKIPFSLLIYKCLCLGPCLINR